jgi:hypothetical protein
MDFAACKGTADNQGKEYVTNIEEAKEKRNVAPRLLLDKLLCRFCTLKGKAKQSYPSRVSKYIFRREIKLLSF